MSRHATPETDSALEQSAAFVRFDSAGRLQEANGEFLALAAVVSGVSGLQEVLSEYLERMETVNQNEIGDNADERLKIVEMWKRPDGVPLEARTRDGQWRMLSASPAGDGGMLFLSVDYSARRSKARFAEILAENIQLPMWINRIDTGEVLFSNKASNRLYEVPPDAQEQRSIAEFFPDREDSIEMLRRLELRGKIENYPVKTKSDSGKEIVVRGCASVIEHDGQKLVVNAVQDLMDRAELEEDTLKARDMLRDAIESLSEGFALYDEDGCLVMFNNRYKEMNHAVADILEPGLDWEILMRETARRGVYAEAIGQEDAWVSARIENGVTTLQSTAD